jgi:hypothetical protein
MRPQSPVKDKIGSKVYAMYVSSVLELKVNVMYVSSVLELISTLGICWMPPWEMMMTSHYWKALPQHEQDKWWMYSRMHDVDFRALYAIAAPRLRERSRATPSFLQGL